MFYDVVVLYVVRSGLIIVYFDTSILNQIKYLKSIQEMQKDGDIIVSCQYANRFAIEQYANEENINIDKTLYKPFTTTSLFKTLLSDKKDLKKAGLKKENFKVAGNVLLVEDNKVNQIVAKQNLKKYGLEVVIAENGEIAVEKVKNGQFNIVFMDLQMPILDGFEATKKIREFNQDIPIIALSAAVMESDKLHTQEVGMNDHIDKPINLNELQNILEKYLGTKSLSRDVEISVIEEKTIVGVDMQELIERINGNKTLAYELLRNFAYNQKDAVMQLDSFNLDSKEFSDYMHNLKGVSGNLSMNIIHKYASEIYINKNIALLPNLKKELELIIAEIDLKLVEKEKAVDEKEKVSMEDLLHTAELFIKELDAGSFIQNSKVESFLNQLRGAVDKENLIMLEKTLKQFEYPQAKEILEKIKGEL